jgi:hypothetical protein
LRLSCRMDCGTTASLNGEMNRLISYSLFIVSAASGARPSLKYKWRVI